MKLPEYESPAQIKQLIEAAKQDGSLDGHPLLYVLWVIAYQLANIAYK